MISKSWIPKPWRDRLLTIAGSAFIAWHATAIVLAPAPDSSAAVKPLRTLFKPYFTLFRLESSWGFFENIGRSAQFRYVIEDADGKTHTFAPVEDFAWYHPRYSWFERTYWAILENPELYVEHFIKFFCRQHAALKPASISLLHVSEQEYRPEDRLDGHRPLDPDFVKVETLAQEDCSQP